MCEKWKRNCALVARIESLLRWGLVLFCVPKENQKSTRYFRGAGTDGLRLPASASLPLASCWPLPQQLLPVSAAGGGRRRCKKGAARPFQTPKELSKHKNASRFAKRIFSHFSGLRLRRWCYVFAELYVLQGRKVCCKAANGRNEKKVQQRRPPPAADTGRSCWGRGQQDTSAAQGTKWTLGTATRLSAAASIFGLRLPLWNC